MKGSPPESYCSVKNKHIFATEKSTFHLWIYISPHPYIKTRQWWGNTFQCYRDATIPPRRISSGKSSSIGYKRRIKSSRSDASYTNACICLRACCVLPLKVCAALLLHHNVLCWPAHLPLGCVSRGHPRRREPCFFTLPSPGMRCDLINTYGYLLMSLSSELSVVSAVRYTESGASLPTPRKGLIAHDGLIWKGCCI